MDEQIRQTGFVPSPDYGMTEGGWPKSTGHNQNGNGSNGHARTNGNGSNSHTPTYRNGDSNGHRNTRPASEESGITEKQIGLINNVIKENNARKGDVEQMAVDMFGGGIRTLNRLQGTNLIDALFERYPKRQTQQPAYTR